MPTTPTRTNPKGFKPGDVVVMKAGSPPMTIESIRTNNPSLINLVWFDYNGCLRRDVLDDFNLVLVPED